MQIYNFFNWFTCCTPKTQECLHSKSIKSCINTEHYTEQIKEAFFAKLLHNKGINLCFCQESTSPDLIQSQNFYFMNGLSKYPFKKDQIFLLKYTTKACVIASLKIINFLTRNLKKNPTAFKSHSDKLPEQKIEDDEKLIQSTKVSIMSLKKISRSKQEFSKLVKGMPEEMVEHLVQRFNNGDLIIDLLNGIHSLSLNVLYLFLSFSSNYYFYLI